MLTLQLRKLEKNKIVKRTVCAEAPPRVEYELTKIGYELKSVILPLDKWGRKHKQQQKIAQHFAGYYSEQRKLIKS